MRINRLPLLLIMLVAVTFISCDPGVQYNKVIQNDSDYDLEVIIYPESRPGYGTMYTDDSLVIYRHTEASILDAGGLGQTFEYEDCDTYADSIVINVVDNDTLDLIISPDEPSNWVFNVLKETYKQGGTCECRLTIRNDLID